jgi:alpha-beta hydrolase superfamily lysophospholipase
VTAPGEGTSHLSRRAVVLISAGLTGKSGPFRLYTELARRLAGLGCLTLRFDLGGIGDSQQADHESPLKARTSQDIRDALDFLTSRFALDHITLAGLCSGADDAFTYAELDARVAEVVLIDPFAYRTAGWRWRNALHRAARRVLQVRARRGRGAPAVPLCASATSDVLVDYKSIAHAESSRILGVLLKREAALHFFYTGGSSDTFNHPGQLQEMFPALDLGRVTVNHLPRLGHTQLLAGDRAVLIESIARRLQFAS